MDNGVGATEKLLERIAVLEAELEQQKQTETALRKTALQYTQLVEMAGVGVWSIDVECRTTRVSDGMAAMLGYTPAEMIGQSLYSFMEEEWRAKAVTLVGRRIRGLAERHSFRFRRKDGSELWAIVSAAPLLIEDGSYAGAVAMITDISEHKRAEVGLRRRLELEKIVSTVSSRLARLNNLDGVINATLADIGKLSGASHASLVLLRNEGAAIDNTHEWCAEGVSPRMEERRNLPSAMFPWWMSKLHKGETIHIANVSTLPPEARRERDILEGQGVKSVLVLPLLVSGKVAGFVGIDNVRESQPWNDQDLAILRVCSEILGNALGRKQVEDALRESEARFRRLAENAPDVIFRYEITPSRGYSYVSPAITQLSGYAPEELYADPDFHWKLVPPEDHHLCEAVARGDREDNRVSIRWRHRDGRTVWTELGVVPVHDDVGTLVAIEGVVRDITERRQTEEELIQTSRQWQETFDAVEEMVVILDQDRRVIRANKATLRACSGAMVSDLRCYELFHGTRKQIPSCPSCRTFDTGEVAHVERYEPHLGGWFEFLSYPVKEENGKIQQVVHILRDITKHKQLEEQLLRAQRLETAGRIAAQVAHDFNNLLVPMTAYPELIKMRLPEGHPALPFCKAMQEAAQQMADINGDMMALGRRGHVTQEPTDLNRVVLQAVEKMPETPHTLTVELDLATDLLPISGSPAQLLRVVSNLVSNAREAMQDIGLLQIRTGNVYVDKPLGRYKQVEIGEYVKATVTDTGCGIAADISDKIFDAFFTTKRKGKRRGSGLGLGIVQAIVEDHRGYIDVESEVGRGTTFSVYVPASRETLREESSEGLPTGNEVVLVVDDDPLQREAATQLLQPLGYRVDAVASGEEAVAFLRGRQVDLLILDMVMPEGIDGVETYRRVLEVSPGQRAIVVSGYAETEQVKEAQVFGAGAYLRKPVTMGKLARAVREELDRDRARSILP